MNTPKILHIPTLADHDWCDVDTIMLYACFQLLTICIEQEELLAGNTDWNHTEETKATKREIEELYKWWTKRKNEGYSFIGELADEQYENDNEMLIRLIKVRRHLWT